MPIKEDVLICDGMLLGHEKEWSNAICSNMMHLEITILSEVSQTEKNEYHMTSLICGI